MSKRKAFTLIELLVVIAIIAILAAILFPVFAQAKAAAKTTATISNQKQQALAMLMYSNDYNDITPAYEYEDADGNLIAYPQIVYPYVKNSDLFFDSATGTLPPDMMSTDGPVFGDWQYYNNLSVNGGGLFGYWTDGGEYKYGRNLSGQEDISERAALVTVEHPELRGAYGYYQFTNWTAYSPDYENEDNMWANLVYAASDRHNNGVVAAMADGSARRVAAGQIFVPEGEDPTEWYGANEDAQNFWGYWYSSSK
ncbi:MAG: prepilin-type N-terminal cleavage/methylation domain-containing protein [Fimbriimonadaceae bacterium]